MSISKPEVALRMSILEDGLHVTGTKVREYTLLYNNSEILPIPRIDYSQRLFKSNCPSLYNDGEFGLDIFMEEGFDQSLRGKDFTFSAWFKADKDPFFNRYCIWSPLIQGNHRWATREGIAFFLTQGEKSNNFMVPDDGNTNGHWFFNHCKSKKKVEEWKTNYKYKLAGMCATSRLMLLQAGNTDTGIYGHLITDLDNPYYITDNGDTEFHHIAFTRENDTFYLFVDGILQNSMMLKGFSNVTFGGYVDQLALMSSSDNMNFLKSVRGWYNDITLITGAALWNKNFTPPTDFLYNEKLAVLGKDKTIWGFTKLANDNTVLSDAQKVELFKKTVPFEQPSISDYKNVNNVFKINKYKENV